MTKKFALTGAAGYVAPRHMKAIKDVGGELVAVLDPHDSVGVLDSYFPNCLYFREPERFERWLSKNQVDYISVCSPNYLHDSHCLMAMRNGADAICEKPLVCNEHNLDNLLEWEAKTGKKVNAILQCRLHPNAVKAKETFTNEPTFVSIKYKTPRGQWYGQSWKSDIEKSGGLPTNIGVHLFDLCTWLFGPWLSFDVQIANKDCFQGSIILEHADIEWLLSTKQDTPERVFSTNQGEIDLTNGFNDLHTESYRRIINGDGFGIEDARPAVRLVEAIRNACA